MRAKERKKKQSFSWVLTDKGQLEEGEDTLPSHLSRTFVWSLYCFITKQILFVAYKEDVCQKAA